MIKKILLGIFCVIKFIFRWTIRKPLGYLRRRARLNFKTKGPHVFHDRKQNKSSLIIILSGYKPLLWDKIFERIEKFAPLTSDICIVSSGKYEKFLADTAEKNNWSYLSTKRNCVSLAQNMAITLHPKAEFIYKLDEDIFVTQNSFEILMDTYKKVIEDGLYEPAFIAPLIPVNAYGHVRILERLGLVKEYEKRFEQIKYQSGWDRMIEGNPEAAKFFWGKDGIVPSIDSIAEEFNKGNIKYKACPIRFSIGFILFSRRLWLDMGMWQVPRSGSGMGGDEVQICNLAMSISRAIIVSENAVAGHLSFGPQNKAMQEYFIAHPEKFSLACE